jgi:ABC-type transport system involved in multi-copper enzyme maturation permease subunit
MVRSGCQQKRDPELMDSPKKRDRAESRRALWAVVQREMRETAWRKRTFITRALSVAFLGVVFGAMVIEKSGMGMGQRQIFLWMGMSMTGFLAAVMPILVSDVIAGERERGTLGLLFLTPLKPSGIVLGKAAGRFVSILSIMIACAPVIVLTFLLGGVEALDVLNVFVAAFFSVVWSLTFCVWISAHSSTVTGAMIAYYGWGIFFLLVMPFLTASVFSVFGVIWHPLFLWFFIVSAPRNFFGGYGGIWFWTILGCVGNTLASLFFFGLTVEKIGEFSKNPGLLRPPLPVVLPQRETGSTEKTDGIKHRPEPIRPRRVSWNSLVRWIDRYQSRPLLWLELRNGLSGLGRFAGKGNYQEGSWMYGVTAMCFVFLLLPLGLVDESFRNFQVLLLFPMLLAVFIVSVVAAAGSIARETESGRMDLLLTTPLSPSTWLWLRAGRIFIGGLGFFLFGTFYIWMQPNGMSNFSGMLESWVIWLCLWLLLMGMAFWISSRVRRSRTALELTFAAACVVVLIWNILVENYYHYYEYGLLLLIATISALLGRVFFQKALEGICRKRQ